MRILLIIPMAIVEIVSLAIFTLIGFIHKPTGLKLVRWSKKNFPDIDWYLE